MRTRRFAVLSLVVLALAGCANNSDSTASSSPSGVAGLSSPSGGPSVSSPSAGSSGSSSSAVPSHSLPSGVPSLSTPAASRPETISGTVSAGVEPHCLILQDAKGSHMLVFDDPALKTSAPAGSKVTLVGHSEPTMMTTCQQGVPFIVTSVTKG
jgi:hypothetical protein